MKTSVGSAMRLRGQSALEYLVTYGWAILAIVIIGAVLWYFGIFNPQTFVGSKRCVGFASFTCQDFQVSSAGQLSIVFNNRVGGRVTGVGMYNGSVRTGLGSWYACNPASVDANGNTTCTISGFMNGANVAPPYLPGNVYDPVTVALNYSDPRSGISHNDAGTIQGKFE
ncbi:hypothetical protein HY995_00455 [Candidatus Micrarchaeota archaeon]|nr:hypothetical protein [Candidatus Micrarchaeota archaeon]